MNFSTDVDECLDSPCDKHADCFDLHAMAQCICSDGFYGDGKTCYGKNIENIHKLVAVDLLYMYMKAAA